MINVNTLLEELKCSICLDFFDDPRTLNCQHSFCSNCLKRIRNLNSLFSLKNDYNKMFYLAKRSLGIAYSIVPNAERVPFQVHLSFDLKKIQKKKIF